MNSEKNGEHVGVWERFIEAVFVTGMQRILSFYLTGINYSDHVEI